MNDSSLFTNEPQKIDSRPPLGEDLLPPVEQPSARFIIQLFVVPALIVILVLSVWLAFNWLVRSTEKDPNQLIAAIEQGPGVARWQRAQELAQRLQDKHYPEFRQSHEAARELARMLNREIDQAQKADEDIAFRKYLVSALGEFDVEEGTDALLKAAKTNRDSADQKVRDAAIQALAVRIYNVSKLDPPVQLATPELEPTLLELAADTDPVIRFQAAYALGHLGTPAAIKQLQVMVNDPDASTRYNAAVALAHRGDVKSIDTLTEMLDMNEQAGVRDESEEGKPFKRTVIIVSAIDAAHALARQNPKANLAPIIKALEEIASADKETLRKANVSERVAVDAKVALGLLKSGK
jgi:HEAT repeat protein